MARLPLNHLCSCTCGRSDFAVTGEPMTRFFCHCLICQSVYKQPYADVTVFRAEAIHIKDAIAVEWKRYRPPPALRRAICGDCGAPVVSLFWVAPRTRLAFVPSRNFPAHADLPASSAHIFYHRRVEDVDDSVAKVAGYWPSQVAVTKLLVASIMRRTRDRAAKGSVGTRAL